MKLSLSLAVLIIVTVGALFWRGLCGQSIMALAVRDLQVEFVITDAETSRPIPDAVVMLQVKERDRTGDEPQAFRLLTDDQGKATFLHRNNSCEDWIRPFKKR
jgi:hypothetical protein